MKKIKLLNAALIPRVGTYVAREIAEAEFVRMLSMRQFQSHIGYPAGARHRLDAFDLFTKLEHGGNRDAALAVAAQEQGRTYTPSHLKLTDEQRIATVLR
jgi:hypothetical protein